MVRRKRRTANKKICFVDSAGWIALLNADDALHAAADAEFKPLMKTGFQFITSTAILNEVANALAKPRHRTTVVEFYKRIQRSHRVKTVFVDKNLWNAGWQLYENRPGKEWSLTDCISIALMEQRGIQVAFTCDRHFKQAGFNVLLS